MDGSVGFLRCTVVDGSAARDVEISASPETTTESLLAALPFDVRGRTVYCGETPVQPAGTLADSPITPGCVLTVGEPGPERFRIPADAIGVLSVLGGPDVGSWAWVRSEGPTSIGRDAHADLVLTARDVSRRHARVEPASITPPRITVTDAGSRNGTCIGEAEISDPTEVPAQGLFAICDDVIQWLPLDRVAHEWVRAADGHVEINPVSTPRPDTTPGASTCPPNRGSRPATAPKRSWRRSRRSSWAWACSS